MLGASPRANLRWIKRVQLGSRHPSPRVVGETHPFLTRINGAAPPAFHNGTGLVKKDAR